MKDGEGDVVSKDRATVRRFEVCLSVLLAAASAPHAAAANPPLASVTQISVGERHACAAQAPAGGSCWGTNFSAALGRSTPGRAAGPISGLVQPLASIAAGGAHSCAATSGGTLSCWGENGVGQLGIGDPSVFHAPLPRAVPSLTAGVTAVAAGGSHTCAIVSGGARCWGSNSAGEVGDGTTDPRDAPVAVTGLASSVSRIAAGASFSCAVVGGQARCWGAGSQGQIGDGAAQPRSTPTPVATLASGVTAIATGSAHACAVSAGTVKCWGSNDGGQLGDATLAQRNAPVNVIGLPAGIVALAAGAAHSCALADNGGVHCWGSNNRGQLGDGTIDRRTIAAPVTDLGGSAIAIAAGGQTTCALLSNGTVRCFGSNAWDQLGINALATRVKPVEVVAAGGFASLDAGAAHTCAIGSGGAASCWGANGDFKLGDGTQVDRAFPTQVATLGSGVAQLTAGHQHSCARTTAGAALCWGTNGAGQLGNGTFVTTSQPIAVSGLSSGVIDIDAGFSHSCAVTTAGAAKCWGANTSGELGDGMTPIGSPSPVNVAGLGATVVRIAVGQLHSCALRSDGGVKCWGDNNVGKLGDGTLTQRSTPVDVVGLTAGVAAIALGEARSCAVLIAGSVRCWGSNSSAQLGDNNWAVSFRTIPHPVSGLSGGVTAIAAGAFHNCALLAGGEVRCWGSNNDGQLGEAAPITNVAEPVPVPLGEPAVAITAGARHSCALLASMKVKCWGQASASQLGNGDALYSPVPRFVVVGDFATILSVATSPSPSQVGDFVTIGVTATSADTIPGGQVILRDGEAMLECGFGGVQLSLGRAQCVVPLSMGLHTITASYGGDLAHLPATASVPHQVVGIAGHHCAGFDDVDAADPLCRNVEWVRNRGITLGCAGFDYCPSAVVSRLSMAAFMNRLGRAFAPEVVSFNVNSVQLFLWSSFFTACTTSDVPAATYPRQAYIDAVVSGMVGIDAEIEFAVVAESQFQNVGTGPAVRRSLPQGKFQTVRLQGAFGIPAGTAPRFGLRLTRIGSQPDSMFATLCSVRAVLVNKDETFSPFDLQ